MTLAPLPEVLRERAVRPESPRYWLLRSTYTTKASPALVLLPENDGEVAAAVRYAADTGLIVSVRSGGHGLSGRSSNNGGIVIDLSAMHRIEVVDAATGLVRVQAGARWANVAERLAPHELAISAGDHGNVGVGGLATAGGLGWLSRSYGLTIDHIRAATIVLPNGAVVRASREHEPDLFWAVRGAGDTVGIVTDFEIEAMRLRRLGIAQLVLEADRDGDALRRWSDHLAAAPHALTTNGVLFKDGARFVLQLTAVAASDDAETVDRLVGPLTGLGGQLLDAQTWVAPYTSLVPTAHLHANVGQQPATTTNALLPALTKASARALLDVASHPARAIVQLRSLGGAINEIDPGDTAYSHRHQHVLAIVSTFPPDHGSGLDAAFTPLRQFADGAYRNFDSRPDDNTFDRAFPGQAGARVRQMRDRYDPEGVLRRHEAPRVAE